MKTYLTRSKSSLIIVISFMTMSALARPVAQVVAIEGQVFMVTAEGGTRSLKINDHMDEKTEVMVDEGGNITLNDYYDATYHLVGGSHMKFFNQSVQLKRGKAWIQSQSKRPLALTTANGHVDFGKSEFIATFDTANSRSQILVVNGDVEVSNVLNTSFKHPVPAGTFTLIDSEVENGLPRMPTKVGLASLDAALSEFKKLPDQMQSPTPTRGIASTEEETNVKKGEIIFINTDRLPASVRGGAHQYYKKTVKKTVKKKKLEGTVAPIKFYGLSSGPVPMNTLRIPASVAPIVVNPKKTALPIDMDQEFADSLKNQIGEQPKHSKELEGLINDLKSY